MSYDESSAALNFVQENLLQQRINEQMKGIQHELEEEIEEKKRAEADARLAVLGLLDSDDDEKEDKDTPTFEEREERKELLKVESFPEFSSSGEG